MGIFYTTEQLPPRVEQTEDVKAAVGAVVHDAGDGERVRPSFAVDEQLLRLEPLDGGDRIVTEATYG